MRYNARRSRRSEMGWEGEKGAGERIGERREERGD
jgi:hypothetical protein